MTTDATMEQFLRELNRNPRMQDELQALTEETTAEITADDLIRFAAAHGFSISAHELGVERIRE